MSKGLKQISDKVAKISNGKNQTERKCLSFNLANLTSNDDFNFSYFHDDVRNECDAYRQLFLFLVFLSDKTFFDLMGLRKEQRGGFEQIPLNEIGFRPSGIELTDDVRITVFRFGSGKYRLLGLFEKGNAVFNIIGFDFNYSAYEH